MSIRISKPENVRINEKGQITIPEWIRQKLGVEEEGDRVAFVQNEDGEIVVKKASWAAFERFADSISQEAEKKGITEEDLLKELKRVRKEMWNERYQK